MIKKSANNYFKVYINWKIIINSLGVLQNKCFWIVNSCLLVMLIIPGRDCKNIQVKILFLEIIILRIFKVIKVLSWLNKDILIFNRKVKKGSFINKLWLLISRFNKVSSNYNKINLPVKIMGISRLNLYLFWKMRFRLKKLIINLFNNVYLMNN